MTLRLLGSLPLGQIPLQETEKSFFFFVLKKVKKIKAAVVLTVSHWVKIFGRYVRRRDRPKEPIDK